MGRYMGRFRDERVAFLIRLNDTVHVGSGSPFASSPLIPFFTLAGSNDSLRNSNRLDQLINPHYTLPL